MTSASPRIEIATAADLAAIHTLRLAQGWSASDDVVRALLEWERGRFFVIRASALAPATTREITIAATTPQPLMATGTLDALGVAETHDPSNLSDPNDPPVVTTGAMVAGEVGVIGSVIVRDDYQRRGLGRYIMQYSIDWVRALGARAVFLDATPAGRPLYSALGFASLALHSWFTLTPMAAINHAALASRAAGLRAVAVAPTETADALARLAALDGAAFGGDRLGLLSALLRLPNQWLFVAHDTSGVALGYLVVDTMVSERYHGLRVGPWVATSDRAAAALLLAALESTADGPPLRPGVASDERQLTITDDATPRDLRYAAPQLVVALPGANPQALDLLRAIGCQLEQDDLLMRLDLSGSATTKDANSTTSTEMSLPMATRIAGDPALVYSWLASMVF